MMSSMMAPAVFASVNGALLSALALITTTRLVKSEGSSASTVTGVLLAIFGTLLWFIGFMNILAAIGEAG